MEGTGWLHGMLRVATGELRGGSPAWFGHAPLCSERYVPWFSEFAPPGHLLAPRNQVVAGLGCEAQLAMGPPARAALTEDVCRLLRDAGCGTAAHRAEVSCAGTSAPNVQSASGGGIGDRGSPTYLQLRKEAHRVRERRVSKGAGVQRPRSHPRKVLQSTQVRATLA